MRRPSELQIYYQRNLLCGLISSLILSITVGIWIGSIGGADTISPFTVAGAGLVAGEVNQAGVTNEKNQRHYRSMKKRISKHEGFLGFVRLRPVGQFLAVPDTRPTDILIEELYPDFSQEEEFESVSSTGDVSDFVSSSGDYYTLGTYERTPNYLLADRNVEVIWRPDPEYPFVARDAGKEGEVTVLVFVDSKGELSVFPGWLGGEGIKTLEFKTNGEKRAFQYAIKEEPTDWFFAKNFMKVLPKWTFTPKIESGIAVSSLLRIKFNFCLGDNCLPLELEQVQSRRMQTQKSLPLQSSISGLNN